MRLSQTARFVILAGASWLVASGAYATELEAAAADAAPAAMHGLFSSWFSAKSSKVEAAVVDTSDESAAAAARPIVAARASDLVVGALGLLGIGYRLGGNTPASGFDCSGLVRYVFQTAVGLDLPRRAEEISRVGAKIDRNELKPGDLVFYKTLRKTFSHVGIYLGNNRFIHSPSSGGSVRVDDMTQSYWSARFNGARRIDPS